MSRLPLQHHILNLSVLIAVHMFITPDQVSRQRALHHPGLLCVCAHIVQLFPLHHILRNRLPVKKDNRDILFPGEIDNLRRIRPVYQVDTEDIAARVNQFLYLIILRPFCPRRIPHSQRRLKTAVLKLYELILKAADQFIEKRVTLIIISHSDMKLHRPLLLPPPAGACHTGAECRSGRQYPYPPSSHRPSPPFRGFYWLIV